MKKALFSIALALFSTLPTFAQYSIGAGYLESTKNSGSVSSGQSGFYVGVNNAIGNLGPFKVTPGVFLEYATSSSSVDYFGIAGASGKATEVYLDIPVHLSYSVNVEGVKMFAFAGPMFSVGLVSDIESNASILGHSTGSTTIDQYAGNENYGRFDLMVGGGVGVDINVLRLTLGYHYGLADRDSGAADLHRSNFNIGLAFLF